jgi:isoamylase
MSRYNIERGKPHPLGATPDKEGVNFSIYSEHADYVELLIFDKYDDPEPTMILSINKTEKLTLAGKTVASVKLLEKIETPKITTNIGLKKTFHFWHVYICGLEPGVHYAYRIYGPSDPSRGYIFDGNKVLIDPYSRGNNKKFWNKEKACVPGDNLEFSMRSVVINASRYEFDGGNNGAAEEIYEVLGLNKKLSGKNKLQKLNGTIIYELHVGGFTRSPTSGVTAPGKFSGVIEKIPYLKELGITAVELMPVFDFDDTIKPDGRKQYWAMTLYVFLLLTVAIV